MKLLTKEQLELYENAKICYICREKVENKYVKDKKYCKVNNHCHYAWENRGAAHRICNLKYSRSRTITIPFQNRSNYDYHFIIKTFAEQSEK